MPLEAKTRFQPNYDLYSNEAVLKIDDVRPNDVGTYTCKANNIAGEAETSAKTLISKTSNIDETPYVEPERFRNLCKTPEFREKIIEDKKKYERPVVIEPLEDFKVYEGDNHRLVCKVDGYPKPKVILNCVKLKKR